jgi:DNA invertase Pin-like site-specific DNA recombinase
MFADARARKFDVVLFWSLGRFSREGVAATLNHLEKLTSYGVAWRSHTDEYLDSCGLFRDAVLAILAVTKQERVRRSERARAAIARLRRQGQADKLGRPRTELSKRAKAQKLRAQGLSLRDIGAELGISAATVQRIVAAA